MYTASPAQINHPAADPHFQPVKRHTEDHINDSKSRERGSGSQETTCGREACKLRIFEKQSRGWMRHNTWMLNGRWRPRMTFVSLRVLQHLSTICRGEKDKWRIMGKLSQLAKSMWSIWGGPTWTRQDFLALPKSQQIQALCHSRIAQTHS